MLEGGEAVGDFNESGAGGVVVVFAGAEEHPEFAGWLFASALEVVAPLANEGDELEVVGVGYFKVALDEPVFAVFGKFLFGVGRERDLVEVVKFVFAQHSVIPWFKV